MTAAAIGFARRRQSHLPAAFLPEDPCLWLESTEAVELQRATSDFDVTSLEQWPAGRCFGRAGEYRWRRNPDGLHIVLIRDDGHLPDDLEGRLELQLESKSQEILWGEVSAEMTETGTAAVECRSAQIPGRLVYPLGDRPSANSRPALRVRRYVVPGHGQQWFSRCVDLNWTGEDESS